MADTKYVRFLEGIYVRVDKQVRGVLSEALQQYQRLPRIVDVVFQVGSEGAALEVGDHAFLRLGLNGVATILSWSLAGTVAGLPQPTTCELDLHVGSEISDTHSIVGSSPPSLTAQFEQSEQEPTGWQATILDPSWVVASVTSADGTLEVVSMTLRISIGAVANRLVVVGEAGEVLLNDAGETLVYGG